MTINKCSGRKQNESEKKAEKSLIKNGAEPKLYKSQTCAGEGVVYRCTEKNGHTRSFRF